MNPQKIAVLTDSCADLPQHILKKYSIYVVPLKVRFSDGEFLDGVTIQPKEIYERLPHEIPKTSLPDGALVEDTLREIQDAGYEKVLAIHLSSGLSGTYNMVRVIGEQFVGLEVVAFDTLSGALGEGLTVLHAAQMIERGWSWTEILHMVPRLIANTRVYFCVDTLEYLQKGGRIGKITAVAGTLLNIKPIITFAPTGELVNVAKVRGRKLAMEKMVSMMHAYYPGTGYYALGVENGDCPGEMKDTRVLLEKLLPSATSVTEGEVDCTLGVYVGPHLLGVGLQLLPEEFMQK